MANERSDSISKTVLILVVLTSQLDTTPPETHPRIELKMSNDQRKQETEGWHSGERTHLPPM